MRVVSKPIEIDVVEWQGNLDDLEQLPLKPGWRDTGEFEVEDDGTLVIRTLEGPARAIVGLHYIAHGTVGEHYPIRNDVFRTKYSGHLAARLAGKLWRLLTRSPS